MLTSKLPTLMMFTHTFVPGHIRAIDRRVTSHQPLVTPGSTPTLLVRGYMKAVPIVLAIHMWLPAATVCHKPEFYICITVSLNQRAWLLLVVPMVLRYLSDINWSDWVDVYE